MDGIHHKFYTIQISVFHCVPMLLFSQATPLFSPQALQRVPVRTNTPAKKHRNFAARYLQSGSEIWAPKNPPKNKPWGVWKLTPFEGSIMVYRYIPPKGPHQQPVNRLIVVNVGGSLHSWYADNRIPPKESSHETPMTSLTSFHNFWFLAPKDLQLIWWTEGLKSTGKAQLFHCMATAWHPFNITFHLFHSAVLWPPCPDLSFVEVMYLRSLTYIKCGLSHCFIHSTCHIFLGSQFKMSSQSRANSQPKQVLCPNCGIRTAWFSDANIDTAENLGAT